jgi:diaminohydroxyphosphoribosylaminopyrimidine deaminase / 5-amino-6-(5-phosphoribosylamino)uracil reductase
VLRAPTTTTPPPGLDLHATLRKLASDGITRLMVEGGARIASSFVAADLVDEVWLFRGANDIGENGVPALDGLPLSAITDAPVLKVRASERFGQDTLTIYGRDTSW